MLPRTPLHDGDAVAIDDLLDRDGELRGRRLRRAARTRDVEIGHLTDEELLIAGRGIGAEPDPFWQPHLAALRSSELREASVEATFRLLHANGFVRWTDLEAMAYEVEAELAVVRRLLATAEGVVTAAIDEPDAPRSASGTVLLADPDLLLHDWIVADVGVHHLLVRRREREVAHLTAMLDPDSRAGARSDEPIIASSPGALTPSPDDLAERATAVSVAARVVDGYAGPLQEHVTTYSCADGLWLLQGRGGPEPVAALQRVGGADIEAVARHLLRPASA